MIPVIYNKKKMLLQPWSSTRLVITVVKVA